MPLILETAVHQQCEMWADYLLIPTRLNVNWAPKAAQQASPQTINLV